MTYQVLSSETAFIGVIKQETKVIGELEKVSIQPAFEKLPDPEPVRSYGYNNYAP